MIIKELLEQKGAVVVDTVTPSTSLLELAKILDRKAIGSAIVATDKNPMIGIVTERDLVRAMSKRPLELLDIFVSDIMTKDIITSSPDDDVSETLNLMSERGIRHMPILEDGELITVISIRDFQIVCDHLGKLAVTDPLTGLPNRREFMKSLNAEYSRYRRFNSDFAVATMDIDFFKKINDEHGHNAGDMILSKFADVFKNRLRAYDVSARVGGEEFGLLFPNTKLEGAVLACNDLLEHIREICLWADTGMITATASFGVTAASPDFANIEEMLKFSDELLYEAKNTGRNQVIGDFMNASGERMFTDHSVAKAS